MVQAWGCSCDGPTFIYDSLAQFTDNHFFLVLFILISLKMKVSIKFHKYVLFSLKKKKLKQSHFCQFVEEINLCEWPRYLFLIVSYTLTISCCELCFGLNNSFNFEIYINQIFKHNKNPIWITLIKRKIYQFRKSNHSMILPCHRNNRDQELKCQ